MMPATKRLSIAVVTLAVAGCVTINVYFPEAAVQDLAQKIEKEVEETAREEAGTDPGGTPAGETRAEPQPPRRSASLLDALLGATPAHAQGVPDPEVTNPAIRKIIESRASRLAALEGFKSQGVIGENNQGLVEIRSLDALSDLRARAEVQKLVRAENADREQLYKEIAAVKNIDPAQLSRVRETYAKTLRNNAKPGDWIQMPDGTWKQKS